MPFASDYDFSYAGSLARMHGGHSIHDNRTVDRYSHETAAERAEREDREREKERAERDAGYLERVQSGRKQREAGESGADLLMGFTYDARRSVDKIGALVARGDFAAAKEQFAEFHDIVGRNMNDLAAMTRSEFRNAGEVGKYLSDNAAFLLRGDYLQMPVSVPGGEKTTLGEALLNDDGFVEQKRKALRGMGFGDTVAEMYFGEHGEAAQSVMNVVLSPGVQARVHGNSVVDAPQVADLTEFLSQRDSGGKLVNVSQMEDLFGASAPTVVSRVMNQRSDTGDYRRYLSNVLAVADGMRNDGAEAGSSLASRAVLAVERLERASLAGLREGDSADQAKLLCGALLSKVVPKLAESVGRVDIESSSFTKAFKEVVDTYLWAGDLGVDLVGEATDRGASFVNNAATWMIDTLNGNGTTGAFSAVSQLKSFLSGIRGADVPTRSGGADSRTSLGRVVAQGSDSLGLDGLAFGLQAAVGNAIAPEVSGGDASLSSAWEKISASEKDQEGQWAKMIRDVEVCVARAMPLLPPNMMRAAASALVEELQNTSGNMSVQSALSDFADTLDDMGDGASARTVRTWLAANSPTDPVMAGYQKALAEYYTRELPAGSPDIVALRVSNMMTELEKARQRGDDVGAYVENILSNRKHFYKRALTEDEQAATPWLVDEKTKRHRGWAPDVGRGDIRSYAAQLATEQPGVAFEDDQENLRQQAEMDSAAMKSFYRIQEAKIKAELRKNAGKNDDGGELGLTI